MRSFTVNPIGTIHQREGESFVQLDPAYIPALRGLDGFGYIQVLWWFDRCDHAAARGHLIEEQPYRSGPAQLGTFATRSPLRPNPIALTTAYVTYLDEENGVIGLAYIDALDGTPVLDIKPYTPSLDRVQTPIVPDWCAFWPDCCEASGTFDWDAVFNF